jgi:hypothetical protein
MPLLLRYTRAKASSAAFKPDSCWWSRLRSLLNCFTIPDKFAIVSLNPPGCGYQQVKRSVQKSGHAQAVSRNLQMSARDSRKVSRSVSSGIPLLAPGTAWLRESTLLGLPDIMATCGKIESMTKHTFNRLTIVHDAHPYGICADCGAKFLGLDEVIHRKFKEHKCNEDASQAAARIVREATDNH